jgi:hypothetical protein
VTVDDGEEATLELGNRDESKSRWVRVMEASGDGGEVTAGKRRPWWVLEGTAPSSACPRGGGPTIRQGLWIGPSVVG